jgi:ABC-type multidrug transport system ATPase subunit
MCDVTNRKIVDQLKDKKPQVTFSCKTEDLTCNFQFWVDRRESFYCALDECEFSQDIGYDRNTTNYRCKHIKCSCIPDRMLCGEDGSIDISDFLTEEIKGPGAFSCSSSTNGCTFEEPAMNELISDVFGDRSIKLDCNASECLHYSEVPGFKRPEKPSNTGLIAGSIAAAAVLLVLLAIALWLMARKSQRSDNLGKIRLSDDESAQLLANHTPAMLQFRDVCYEVNGKRILQGVRGNVRPGEILAILGASGAGKTSFLDLLARKNKTGTASGDFFVNGRQIKDSEYKDVIGFVDQEDALMPTLTVYETVLYSALLRLPRDMTIESKRLRVYETLEELGILHIKDSLIGQEGSRGISGGEKRRVSIACELVTSPSILFLDEPTSGLDSYNAYNVAECLSNLARGYNRTIVMTIHQPRSNIVALFDQLVLLARGRVVYSGELSGCQTYFESVGLGCPPGYNIADYLIDLTMNSVSSQFASPLDSSTPRNEASQDDADAGQPHTLARCTSINNESSAWGEIGQRPRNSQAAQQRALFNGKPDLDELFTRYEVSDTASNINDRIKAAVDEAAGKPTEMTTPLGRGYRRIGWPAQFVLLSKRTFKNLYRNPMLLLTHYAIAILLARK